MKMNIDVKKFGIVGGVVLVVILICVLSVQMTQNTAIGYEEKIEAAKSNITVVEKKRNDIVTNLAACVKAYDKHEYETLMAVIEARKSGNITDADITEVNKIIEVVAESYPELKSNEQYKTLMEALELNENSVARYRESYNALIRDYNTYCRKFPNKQFLGMAGYEKIDYEKLNYEVEDIDVNSILTD